MERFLEHLTCRSSLFPNTRLNAEAYGTNPGIHCPAHSVTRAQMAVFLTATFGLQ